MRRAILMCLLGGCGSVADDGAHEDAAAPDATVEVDAAAEPIDGAPAATPDAGPRCHPAGAFAEGEPITELNTTNDSEDGASLSLDERTIYFTRGLDIWTATRDSIDEDFDEPEPVPGDLNTLGYERRPSVTADGLTMYLFREVTAGNYELLVAARAQPDANFGVATELGIAGADNYILPDHSALYFAGPGPDLWRAARQSNGFDEAIKVPGTNVNSEHSEGAPVVSADELTLFFSSTRKADYAIYVAKRSSTLGGFGEPKLIEKIHTPAIEYPNWISPDGCRLYFTRMQSNANKYDLFVTTRGMTPAE